MSRPWPRFFALVVGLVFAVPFADLLAQLDPGGLLGLNQNSAFQYVIGTSSQANSVPLSASGIVLTPEPSSGLLVGLGLLLLAAAKPR